MRGRRGWARVAVATVALAVWSETAARAENEIDAAVCEDEERAGWWNEAWAITFGVAAVASAGVATFAPADWLKSDTRAGLYVTATKATLGVAAKLIQPLDIDVAGVCHDRRPESMKKRHAILDEVARRERRALIPNIFGGLLVNAFGLLYLGYGRGAWETGWISFGTGSAVAVASVLTAPTSSWLLRRRLIQAPRVAAVPQLGRQTAGVALVAAW
jgi:hypothetical protein